MGKRKTPQLWLNKSRPVVNEASATVAVNPYQDEV